MDEVVVVLILRNRLDVENELEGEYETYLEDEWMLFDLLFDGWFGVRDVELALFVKKCSKMVFQTFLFLTV